MNCKKIYFSVVFSILVFFMYAQKYDVTVSEVNFDNNTENWCWTINQSLNNSILFGVNHGVVFYDGNNQDFLRTPFTPMASLTDSINHRIFISGLGNLGYLQQDLQGDYQYHSINKRLKNNFKKIILIQDTVCFISDSVILRYHAIDNTKIDEFTINEGSFDAVFKLNNQLYFIYDYIPYFIEGREIKENYNLEIPVDDYSFTCEINHSKILLGTMENNLYLLSSKGFKVISLNNAYFDNNAINNGALLNDSTLILSSIGGGVAVVDLNKALLVKSINYFSGLPDDEIRSLFIDDHDALWVSHEFGVNRIDLNLGIENFSHYPGLEGNPLAVSWYGGRLYVATTDGVYRLDEVKNYDEVKLKVPINVAIEMPIIVPAKMIIPEDSAVDKTTRKRKFGFIRRDKKKKETVADSAFYSLPDTIMEKRFERRIKTITKRNLKSINYYYKPVGNLDGKFTRFISFENKLLVGSNKGLYSVENNRLAPIIKDAYIYDAFLTADGNQAYFGTNDGLFRIKRSEKGWETKHFAYTAETEIKSITYQGDSLWVMTYDNSIVRALIHDMKFAIQNAAFLTDDPGNLFLVRKLNDSIKVLAGNNIYYYSSTGGFELLNPLEMNYDIRADQSDYTWVHKDDNWSWFGGKNPPSKDLLKRLSYFSSIRYIHYLPKDNVLWLISGAGEIQRIDGKQQLKTHAFTVAIEEVFASGKRKKVNGSVFLKSDENNISLKVKAPVYYKQNTTLFSYRIFPMENSWSQWNSNAIINIGYIPYGSYTIQVRAKDLLGNVSLSKLITLNIAKPFVQTTAFYFLAALGILLFSFVAFRIRVSKLNRDKTLLEQKVRDRTATILNQKTKIEKQHEEITQSIEYAKNIQSAMLPDSLNIGSLLPEHFVFFKPRDIVSGDFYFFKEVDGKIVFIAADCTGHGVPGGFMSMLGISYLSELTGYKQGIDAAEILNHLRTKIKLTLKQSGNNSFQKDGMDMAVCIIDTKHCKLQYAGAFNPLLILRNGTMDVIKADRQPVSIYYNEKDFTNHEIEIKKGDAFYMYSDGFPDQLGGENDKKYMTKRFKQLIQDIHMKPMELQKIALEKEFTAWKGNQMQVDDVLVIGFRINN